AVEAVREGGGPAPPRAAACLQAGPRRGERLAVVAGDDQASPVRASPELDADAGARRVPRPARPLHLGRDLLRPAPGPAVVAARKDEDVGVVAGEGQPDDAGGPVHDGARVADGDLRRAALLVHEGERAPGLAAVGAAL